MFTFKDKKTDEKLNPHLFYNHSPPPLPKFSLESAVTSATLPVVMVKMPGRAAGPQLPQTGSGRQKLSTRTITGGDVCR